MTKTAYAYDARGNQTQQVQTGTGVTTTSAYGYDLANRLISSGVTNNAVNPLSTSATYAYNAQGQRVTRVEDEVVTHFYYTGSALLFTTVNEYVLQTQNILDPSGTIVASKRFEGQAATGQDPYAEDYFFYRYDIRGSVTNIVDGAGAVVKSYDYDEFGVTTSTGDAFFNEVTFTGSISDASGLLYMNARYYNPSTARFLSQDSCTGSAFDPWTQHLYAYCNNNPVNMVDPTGHSALLIALLVAITTTVLVSTGCSPESQYNCTSYAYGLDEKSEYSYGALRPGMVSDSFGETSFLADDVEMVLKDPFVEQEEKSAAIYAAIKADAETMGMYAAPAVFATDEEGHKIPEMAEGNWVIAFSYDLDTIPEFRFHFWKYDGNEWTHKPGKKEVRNYDMSGEMIGKNLEGSDRGIYTGPIYYFEFGPNVPLQQSRE